MARFALVSIDCVNGVLRAYRGRGDYLSKLDIANWHMYEKHERPGLDPVHIEAWRVQFDAPAGFDDDGGSSPDGGKRTAIAA